jgi:hypothetical protein
MGVFMLIVFAVPASAQSQQYLHPKCTHTLYDNEIRVVEVGDTDNNGKPNILIGAGVAGLLQDFEYVEGECADEWPTRYMYSTTGSIEDIVITDIESDKKPEILINGLRSRLLKPKDPKYFVTLLNGQNFDVKWYDNRLCGQTISVAAADLNNDGKLNIIAGSEDGVVCAYDDITARTGSLSWRYKTPYRVSYLEAVDLEGDGKIEVVALSSSLQKSAIYVLDTRGKLKWSYEVPYGSSLTGGKKFMKTMHLNNDNVLDFVLASRRGIQVFSMKDGLLWEYVNEDPWGRPLKATTVALNREKKEIIAAFPPYITAIDRAGDVKWSTHVDTSIYTISIGDITGDGVSEIIGGGYRYLVVLDGNGKKLDELFMSKVKGTWRSFFKEPIDLPIELQVTNTKIADLDKDGRNEVVAAYTIVEPRPLKDDFKRTTMVVFEPVTPLKMDSTTTTTTIKPVKSTSTTIRVIETTTTTTMAIEPKQTTSTTILQENGAIEAEGGYGPYPIIILVLVAVIMMLTYLNLKKR